MSISFTGLASGLPVNDIITQLMAIERQPINMMETQKTKLQASRTYVDNVETRVNTLKSSIMSFTDGNIVSGMDLFKKKQVNSSAPSVVTATAGANAVEQSIQVKVNQLATATKAESLGASANNGQVGAAINAGTIATSMANGTLTAGNFTVSVGNAGTGYNTYQIALAAGDSIGVVLGNIVGGSGGTITGANVLADGTIQITPANVADNIKIGAVGDTSNFASATQLDVGDTNLLTGALTSKNPLTAINTAGLINGNAVNLTTAAAAGNSFQIGTVTFTIAANTTMDSLIQEINNSSGAGVTASFNLRTNKIELVAADPGQTAIYMRDTAGTFLQNSANLLQSAGDSVTYQTLGKNAIFQINDGTPIESTTNTVDGSITGLKDVTLNLLNTSTTNTTITIDQNTTALVDAVKKFVADFNAAIKYIDEQTDPKTGKLAGDSALIRLRNNLRTTVTDIVSGSPLYSLSAIGLTTGSIGVTGDPGKTLLFDETKFLAKLQEAPDDVRTLFIGDDLALPTPITGTMEKLGSYVNAALDTTNGYFSSRDAAIGEQLSDLNKSIARAQDRLDAKEKMLKQQFSAMESAISKLKAQSSYLGGQTSATS